MSPARQARVTALLLGLCAGGAYLAAVVAGEALLRRWRR